MELLSSPTAAAVAALAIGLAWLVYLTCRTIMQVSAGDGAMHSDWPDDLTEIIEDHHGQHHDPGPNRWYPDVTKVYSKVAGRHRRAVEA